MAMRFPFPSFRPPRRGFPTRSTVVRSATVAAVTAAGIAAGVSLAKKSTNPFLHNALDFIHSNFSSHSALPWGSLSLADGTVTESNTGVTFPEALNDSQQLLGIGVRRKAVLGLKNIDVYAFGVYVDEGHVKAVLGEKHRTLSKEVTRDLIESDVSVTVRLEIVYGRLSIRSVRNAFEDSVGNQLKKLGGSDNKELLQRFTSQFSDEYKIPRGTIINLSREQDHVLRTTIDGKEVGRIQSQLLCRSILELYIGDEPFDQKAKENIDTKLASVIQSS